MDELRMAVERLQATTSKENEHEYGRFLSAPLIADIRLLCDAVTPMECGHPRSCMRIVADDSDERVGRWMPTCSACRTQQDMVAAAAGMAAIALERALKAEAENAALRGRLVGLARVGKYK